MVFGVSREAGNVASKVGGRATVRRAASVAAKKGQGQASQPCWGKYKKRHWIEIGDVEIVFWKLIVRPFKTVEKGQYWKPNVPRNFPTLARPLLILCCWKGRKCNSGIFPRTTATFCGLWRARLDLSYNLFSLVHLATILD